MEIDAKLVERWRYLRELLMQQLNALERGIVRIHNDGVDISPTAIGKLKWEVADFDALIADAAIRGDIAREEAPGVSLSDAKRAEADDQRS